MKTASFLLAAACLLAGCANVDTRIASDAHLDKVRHIWVEHRLADGRNLDDLIARELRNLGYDASAGPLTLAPRDADAIVTYDDQWTFDFTTYLIKLDVRIRDARTAKPLAAAELFRPSITGDRPSDMIHKVLGKMLKPKVPPVPFEDHSQQS